MNPESKNMRKGGFTLIELLVVVGIMLILMAILIPTIGLAKEKARKALAFSEMKSIESALREYLTTYRKPPSSIGAFIIPSEATRRPITGAMAQTLGGKNVAGLNPKNMRFMDFKRVDSNGDPITPWGSQIASENSSQKYYYFAKFDYNFDHTVAAGVGEPDDPPLSPVGRDFIVWTYNPGVEVGTEGHVLRSWEQ